jgi:monoamine oxidase
MPNETDVVVVGAGVAGLAASAALRRRGRDCVLIEASGRIGGRAFTGWPAALRGAPFDHGASWLHDADHNPLAKIAQQAGDRLMDTDLSRGWVSFVGGRRATADELAAAAHAEHRFHDVLRARAAGPGPDVSLADAADALRDDPWTSTVEAWEGPIVAAADATELSLRDWAANLLGGRNLSVGGGVGALVLRRLAQAAGPVAMRTPATRIAWGGKRVIVETPRGSLAARACIVTVSTGVLAAGAIRFDPALPPDTEAAIEGLPMGLLTKIAIPASGADRLDLPLGAGMDRMLSRPGEPMLTLHAWPHGFDHVIGFIGGGAAWALAQEGAAATEAFARDDLRCRFGVRADAALGHPAVVTLWGTDPHIRGSYAYARPGHAGARATLARPLAGGRLCFAGEACHAAGLAGTVAGAYLTGEAAAAACD